MSAISITRTVYDPVRKDFVTESSNAKALPNIKQWINQHNPVIYWYILRIDNLTDTEISQWAVELYSHRALTITEAYIDGSDRSFEFQKDHHGKLTGKCVLSIPRQIGIPIVSKGIRRIFFKVDIDPNEGIMHEYGISGQFRAQGTEPVEIKEKMFQYSCKVGEFKQIFNIDPDEASKYVEKSFVGKYSSNAVHVFTNSFRMIYELYNNCRSDSLDMGELLQKLHLLHNNFDSMPEIASEHITLLINDGIRELDVIVDRDNFALRLIKLCDALVELLHIEVMSAELMNEGIHIPPPPKPEPPVRVGATVNGQTAGNRRVECLTCRNIITESNKSLICTDCGTQFCTICEGWFRSEHERDGESLCKDCYFREEERLREVVEREVQIRREGVNSIHKKQEEVHLYEKNREKSAIDEKSLQSEEITIKRDYTHRGRFIRFKTKVQNNTQYPIRDVKVHLSFPSTLRCESPKTPESTIGDIEAGETLACEFMLKPLACTTATVKGYIVYKDISGEIQTLTIRGKEIETCRPNLEHLPLTFADVTETISSKQLYKDSEHIKMDGINSADARPLLLKTAQWMNMHHVDDNGHEDQLIFVGRQKVEQTMVIARAALRGDGVKVRCYVEKEDLVAGFLAEFAENLEELVVSSVKPSSDVIWRVMDLFEEIEDTLVYNPSKDQIFTYLNKAHEICRSVDKGISKEIAAFVDNVQLVKEHKDSLDDADITTLKQNIDSWNEIMRGKMD